MKAQIISWKLNPVDCAVEIKRSGDMGGYQIIHLPTHETLTEESLKAAIKTAIEQSKIMKERMALLETLMFQEIELD